MTEREPSDLAEAAIEAALLVLLDRWLGEHPEASAHHRIVRGPDNQAGIVDEKGTVVAEFSQADLVSTALRLDADAQAELERQRHALN